MPRFFFSCLCSAEPYFLRCWAYWSFGREKLAPYAVRPAGYLEHRSLNRDQHIALDNPTAADHLLDTMDDKAQTLAQSPLIGKARNELMPGIRSFPIGNYVLFYQQIEGGIEIIRVLHGARYIETLFTK